MSLQHHRKPTLVDVDVIAFDLAPSLLSFLCVYVGTEKRLQLQVKRFPVESGDEIALMPLILWNGEH